MAKISRTWWGNEFLLAIENFMDQGRLRRGRSYRTDNRILSWDINGNTVTATIRGSINSYYGGYEEPIYHVSIRFKRISRKKWGEIIDDIAMNTSWLARLMLGEIPLKIEDAFNRSDEHFLPASIQDLETECSCPDVTNPCKHIAGLYFKIAELLDQDPILLFELRGLSRENLQGSLLKSELGAALSETLSLSPLKRPKADPSYFTQPMCHELPESMDLHHIWGVEPKQSKSDDEISTSIPAILVKKQGDYPSFWNKDASFIKTMEDIYSYIKTKNKL